MARVLAAGEQRALHPQRDERNRQHEVPSEPERHASVSSQANPMLGHAGEGRQQRRGSAEQHAQPRLPNCDRDADGHYREQGRRALHRQIAKQAERERAATHEQRRYRELLDEERQVFRAQDDERCDQDEDADEIRPDPAMDQIAEQHPDDAEQRHRRKPGAEPRQQHDGPGPRVLRRPDGAGRQDAGRDGRVQRAIETFGAHCATSACAA